MSCLILFRKPPYGSSALKEARDAALAFAAFDQTVYALFMEDGVYQLLKDNKSNQAFCAFPVYGIPEVKLCQDSLSERNLKLDQLLDIPCQLLDRQEIASLFCEADIILSY